MGYTNNPREKCENCIYRKKLWWREYDEDGYMHVVYGNVCIVMADEDTYYKMDGTEGLCECFTDKDVVEDERSRQMVNEKEALEWLDTHAIGNLEAKAIMSKALEKQIPMKPLFHWTGNEEEILCPCCKKYPFDDSEYEWARQYCGNCGQAIDWGEEDGKEEKA